MALRPAIMPLKLVIHPPVEPERLAKITAVAGEMRVVNAADEVEALREIADGEAFFGKLTPALLAAARRLWWVQSPTASLEHYLFPELIAHPCVLTNMRGLYSDVIADHVFGFITCFARNFHLYIRQQLEGRWQPIGGGPIEQPFATGPATVSPADRAHSRLADNTLGIVGLGHIGGAIARRGVACGMPVIAVDPRQTEGPPGVSAVWPVERLGELLARSDFVVIAAPHTPQTAKMFRREQFRQMKPSAYLINIGRGAIVDLTDLTAALVAGEIAGAGLDVCEIEPLPSDHPLWRMENVILTPHVAACTPRIAERHLEKLLDNIRRFAAGEPLVNVVDKSAWF
jgi:phosphoglycerate dehydrogenase-like enzyme